MIKLRILVVILFCLFIASMVTISAAIADSNLSDNPGTEEVDEDTGMPLEWGHYAGAGGSEVGATDETARSGSMSAFLTVTEYYQKAPQYVDWINQGLLFGESNGYIGDNAFDMTGDTEYYYSFWIKAKDAADFKEPCIHVLLRGWAGGTASANRVASGEIEGSPLLPTNEWTLYTGKLMTPAGTVKGALFFQISGNNAPCNLGATFYVDDAYLGLDPPPESLLGTAVDSVGKIAGTWGSIKVK